MRVLSSKFYKGGSPIRILAFDQSTQKTGWALFDRGVYVVHGCIDCHEIKDSKERFARMAQEIFRRILLHKPDFVVLEDTVIQCPLTATKQLVQLQGVMMGFCINQRIPYDCLSPAIWRNLMDFKPSVEKQQILHKAETKAYVLKNLNIPVNEDEANAICIGFAFIKKQKTEDITC